MVVDLLEYSIKQFSNFIQFINKLQFQTQINIMFLWLVCGLMYGLCSVLELRAYQTFELEQILVHCPKLSSFIRSESIQSQENFAKIYFRRNCIHFSKNKVKLMKWLLYSDHYTMSQFNASIEKLVKIV